MNCYNKVKLLGRGAFGEAWIVENNNKKYVMKILRTDQVKIENFHKEIETLKKISNNCGDNLNSSSFCLIETFISYPIKDTVPSYIIITNYLENAKELTNFMYTLDLQNILFIMQRLLEQLHTFHNNNITHSDIKPQNIIIQINDNNVITNVLFIDFGLACTQKMCKYSGTIAYMAPESLKNVSKDTTQENLKKTDIWSLGIVFYRLLNKKFPYPSYEDYIYNKNMRSSSSSENSSENSENDSENDSKNMRSSSENSVDQVSNNIIKGDQLYRLYEYYTKNTIKSNFNTSDNNNNVSSKLNFIVESMLIQDPDKRITINEIISVFQKLLLDNNNIILQKRLRINTKHLNEQEYTE